MGCNIRLPAAVPKDLFGDIVFMGMLHDPHACEWTTIFHNAVLGNKEIGNYIFCSSRATALTFTPYE